MTILTLLNVSNPGNLHADSGFVFLDSLLRNMLLYRPDWKFLLLAPDHPYGLPRNVFHIAYKAPIDKYGVRFGFGWDEVKACLQSESIRPDLIWSNQPELTGALKAAVQSLFKFRVPAVTYFHYLPYHQSHDGRLSLDVSLDDYGIGTSIAFKQREGFEASDLSIVASNFAKKMLIHGSQQFSAPVESTKIRIIPPPTEPSSTSASIRTAGDNLRVLYNHRLYDHYGTKDALNLIEEIGKYAGGGIEVVVCSPHSKRTASQDSFDRSVADNEQRLGKMRHVRIVRTQDRATYLREVAACDLAVGPLRSSAPWSMSVLDAMALGVPVLVPNMACFPEIVDDESTLVFSDQEEFMSKFDRLVTHPSERLEAGKRCRERAARFSAQKISTLFASVFEELVYAPGQI